MYYKMNITPQYVVVLRLLARSPNRRFYVREVARLTESSPGGCGRTLRELSKQGLVFSTVEGKNLYYWINEQNPAIRHFKIYINILELEKIVSKLKAHVFKIVLFGSCANGTDTDESDIDILIIAHSKSRVLHEIGDIKLGRPVKPIVLTPAEYLKKKKADPAFYSEVEKGIVLWEVELNE
jgi:predicted nucleotidyltransferase